MSVRIQLVKGIDYTQSGGTITLAQSGGTYDGSWSWLGQFKSVGAAPTEAEWIDSMLYLTSRDTADYL